MAINPLDVIGNQVKSAARNQVRTAQAEFRRETSIVGYANARIGAAAKKLDQARKKPGQRQADEGGGLCAGAPGHPGPGRLCAPFPGAAPPRGAGLL